MQFDMEVAVNISYKVEKSSCQPVNHIRKNVYLKLHNL